MAEYIDREAALTAVLLGANRHQMAEYIANLPAADVRPVVRGKWTRQRITFTSDAEIFLCSACTDISFRASRFCYNCGADMRPQGEAE